MPKPQRLDLLASMQRIKAQLANTSELLERMALQGDLEIVKRTLRGLDIVKAGIPVGTRMYRWDDQRAIEFHFVSLVDEEDVEAIRPDAIFGTEAKIVGRRSDFVYQIEGLVYDLFYWERA